MSYKTQTLQISEIQISINDLFYQELLSYALESGKKLSQLKVLDWGCGRGRYVGFLVSQGIDSFGVDIDKNVISQAKSLFEKNYWEIEKRLCLIGLNNRTNFPNEYFDFVFSDQVFEHVQDIRGLFNELNRITKKNGRQIHRWPSKFKIIEPHLFMPLIHWLPKGFLRYFGILVYTACGIEPQWSELDGQSVWSKARTYTKYSHQKTYYRHLYVISRLFNTSWKIEYFPKYKKFRKLFQLQFKTVVFKLYK